MKGRPQIAMYFGCLLFFSGMGDPTGLLSVPLLFILKDQLQAGPEAAAVFEAIVMIPAYAAFLFGVLRDRWSPFGRRDRGYLILAAPAAIAAYLWLAAVPLGYGALMAGVAGAMIAYQMLDTSASALLTVVGQRESATGRLSAFSETIETVVNLISVAVGGWMVSHVAAPVIFLCAGAFSLAIFVQAFWSPRGVFPRHSREQPEHEWKSMRDLVAKLIPHGRTMWPVMVILLLYNFSPGWQTPLFYFLTDKLHLSSEAFGACRAVQYAGILVAMAVYASACRRWPLRRLLSLAIAINILPGFLYLLIGGTAAAIAVSAVIGMVSGFATVAVFDLLMRSCPPGLEGSAMALGHSVFGLAGAFGDVVGAAVYSRGGMPLCLFMDAAATVLILPMLRRLPDAVMLVTDQEPEPAAMSVGA
jgi:Na+/melibiose symporter-like transporter